MIRNVMPTKVVRTEYLPSQFKALELVMTPDEKAQATVKGWDILGVEGGSETIYHHRIPDTLAPKDFTADMAFTPLRLDCVEATGRTWGNGQRGPQEADVTFSAVSIAVIGLDVLKSEAKDRSDQATTQSEAYKLQRRTLDALEAVIKDRLAKLQASTVETATASGKPGK
jgi:hypothetical protein